jgi:hypothetical protein
MAYFCEPTNSWNKGNYSGFVDVGGRDKRLTTAEAFTINRATILSDSMCKEILNCLSTRVQCIHGGHLSQFANYCDRRVLEFEQFGVILLFFGTNDIQTCPGPDTPVSFTRSLARAIRYIRARNLKSKIGVCEIMPRPCDQLAALSKDKVVQKRGKLMLKVRSQTNKATEEWCGAHDIAFFHASSCLKGKDKTIPLFAPDNLHLSEKGAVHLQKYLEGKVGVLRGQRPQSQIN